METGQFTVIVRRVGMVVLAIGLIDTAVSICGLLAHISHPLGLGPFAIVAGIFLLSGDLSAIRGARQFGTLAITLAGVGLLVFPFVQPVSLWVTKLRIAPFETIHMMVWSIMLPLLLYWIVQQFSRPEILDVFHRERVDPGGIRRWVLLGVGAPLIVGFAVFGTLAGATGKKAMAMAQAEVGATYEVQVTSLSIRYTNGRKRVSAVVTAWDRDEIKEIPVRWEE